MIKSQDMANNLHPNKYSQHHVQSTKRPLVMILEDHRIYYSSVALGMYSVILVVVQWLYSNCLSCLAKNENFCINVNDILKDIQHFDKSHRKYFSGKGESI